MLFFSFFKTLVNHQVTVELKNDVSIRGTLKSVDQYLNIKLDHIEVLEETRYPHLVRGRSYSPCRGTGAETGTGTGTGTGTETGTGTVTGADGVEL